MKLCGGSRTVFLTALVGSLLNSRAANLFPVVEGDRWGYVDKAGTRVINPQFERAEPFTFGLAAVRLGKWGYFDASGKIAINPQFDHAAPFSEGLAAVELAGRWGY